MTPGVTLGASYAPGDGYIDPPSNVLAYTAAWSALRGRASSSTRRSPGCHAHGGRVTDVRTTAGDISTERVVLTGGPTLAAVGTRGGGADPGRRCPSSGRGHARTTRTLAAERLPMVFDVASGIYWRPEEGGILWGMSNPDGAAGRRSRVRLGVLRPGPPADGDARARSRRSSGSARPGLRPSTSRPTTSRSSARCSPPKAPVDGTTVAAAGGHGMMWGPGVSRAAADLVLERQTDVVDTSDLGLDRFDEHGRSQLAADPIALPFPEVGSSRRPARSERRGSEDWRRTERRPPPLPRPQISGLTSSALERRRRARGQLTDRHHRARTHGQRGFDRLLGRRTPSPAGETATSAAGRASSPARRRDRAAATPPAAAGSPR